MTAVPFSNEIEEISMDGFQVVSGEYFTRRIAYFSPTCTIWSGGITFNKVALTALNNCERVRIEIHPQKKSVLLVPVTIKDKDGIPWRKNIKDYAPRRMECSRFSSTLYEMWGWDTSCVYRTAGRIVTVDNKVMLLFDFNAPEQWRGKEKKAEK